MNRTCSRIFLLWGEERPLKFFEPPRRDGAGSPRGRLVVDAAAVGIGGADWWWCLCWLSVEGVMGDDEFWDFPCRSGGGIRWDVILVVVWGVGAGGLSLSWQGCPCGCGFCLIRICFLSLF